MKIYQLNINLNHLYETCLAQFASKVPAGVKHIVLKDIPDVHGFNDIRLASNGLRFKLLSQPCDVMYADADTVWGKGFPENMDRSKPWISSPDGKCPNASIIISFGHGEWFQSLYNEYMAEPIKHILTYAEVLARHVGEYNILPKDSFYEINLGMTRNNDVLAIGTDNFSVNRDEYGEWKFSFLRGVIE